MKPLLLLLLGVAPAAFAQEPTEPTPLRPSLSRLYVAVQPGYFGYPGIQFIGNFTTLYHFYPIGVGVGYWFQPEKGGRLGVEFNYTARFPADEVVTMPDYNSRYQEYDQAFTLLMRYELPPATPAGRWTGEVATGITRYLAHQQLTSYSRTANPPLYPTKHDFADIQLLLGGGGAYRLAPHWQLTGEVRLQVSGAGVVFNSISRSFGGGVVVGGRYYF